MNKSDVTEHETNVPGFGWWFGWWCKGAVAQTPTETDPNFAEQLPSAFNQHPTSFPLSHHNSSLNFRPLTTNRSFWKIISRTEVATIRQPATMPRRFDYDNDEDRLPDGMVRVGYDADTQVYTFRDTDGSLWEGPPGCQYGHMTKVADAPKPPSRMVNFDVEAGDADADTDADAAHEAPPSYDESEAAMPFLNHAAYAPRDQAGGSMAKHWRAELMPLLNFFMILALFLVGLFWFLGWMTSSKSLSHCGPGSHAHQIQSGESCWSIADMHQIELDKLRNANEGIDCDLLRAGGTICVPAMPKV